jgi:23S rRNA (uridine2552-2'-O)-methyltransferase
LLCKVFHGSGYSQLVKLFKNTFVAVRPIKPKASRGRSSETFLVGIGLKQSGPDRSDEPNCTYSHPCHRVKPGWG